MSRKVSSRAVNLEFKLIIFFKSANLVNSIPLICIAARQLPISLERIAVLKHLKDIEDKTGWKTQRHILDLEKLWGITQEGEGDRGLG